VTIHSDIFGTVPNFDGLSRENYEVFWDAELSRIPNAIPILSRFECNVMSHVAVDHFDGPISTPNLLSSVAFIQAQNTPNQLSASALPRTPLVELMTLPRPLVGCRGDTLYASPSTPSMPQTVSQVSDLWSPYAGSNTFKARESLKSRRRFDN